MTELEKLKRENEELAAGIRAVRRMMDESQRDSYEYLDISVEVEGSEVHTQCALAWESIEKTDFRVASARRRDARRILEPFYTAEQTVFWGEQ